MTVRFEVLAHIQFDGDVRGGPGDFVGVRGTGQGVEGFAITLEPGTRGLGLRYRADIRGQGDTGWVAGGAFVGSRGQGRALEGFRIELTGECLADYDVLYMGYIAGGGDTEWLANGEYCGLHGQGRHLGGLAIRIMPRRPDYVMLVSKAVSGSGKPLAITASASVRSTEVLVSACDGSDLQLWDRRPVRGQEGYALINRARPNMCIARGQDRETLLKHVASIDTNDRCLWLDDTVKGPWNAIRSKTELELKLNMRGDPPYADQHNTLIVHPWSRAVPNELWQQQPVSCDLAGSTDEVALNDILRAIHRGCYPELFKGELLFPASDISKVAFDLGSAPTAWVPSTGVLIDPADPASLAVFIVSIDGIGLAVEGAAGTWTATASLEMPARVRFQAFDPPLLSVMTLELMRGRLRVPGHPEAEARLNELLTPWLVAHFNLHIFAALRVPVIGLLGNVFGPPVVSLQHPRVTAAFAKAPHATIEPRPTAWPSGKVSTGIGISALNTALGHVLARSEIYKKWSYEDPDRGLDVWADYRLRFGNPSFAIFPLSDDRCRVRIGVNGYGVLWIRQGFVPIVRSDGYLNCSARLVVKDDNKIAVVLDSIDAGVFDWVPDDEVYPEVLMAFSEATKAEAAGYLRGRSFELCTVPAIQARIVGRTFAITLRGLEVSTFADAEQRPMVLVTGTTSTEMK